jgi:hypothetical protein
VIHDDETRMARASGRAVMTTVRRDLVLVVIGLIRAVTLGTAAALLRVAGETDAVFALATVARDRADAVTRLVGYPDSA